MTRKYEFVSEDTIITPDGNTLTRIRALSDIPNIGVSAGTLGGYLQTEKNLSHEDDAWVGEDAQVYGSNAEVSGNAQVSGYAQVYDNSKRTWEYSNR